MNDKQQPDLATLVSDAQRIAHGLDAHAANCQLQRETGLCLVCLAQATLSVVGDAVRSLVKERDEAKAQFAAHIVQCPQCQKAAIDTLAHHRA